MNSPTTPRIAVAAVFAAWAPLLLAQDPAASRRNYATSKLIGDRVEVQFSRWGDAILIENVMVNGKGPYRFLFDTGAEGAGRVDASLIDALKLPAVGTGNSLGILGQQQQMTRHRLDTLAIGKLSFKKIEMLGRDYNASMKGPGLRPIHGILGFHLFSEYLLTIDYPARKITIARGDLPAPDGKQVLPIVSDDEDPEIEIMLGGRKTTALLDTGAMVELGVPASIADGLKFAGEPVVRGEDGGGPVRSATLDGVLLLGELEIAKPTMMIAARVNQTVVGAQTLAALRVTYDQRNARVRIERPAPRKTYGLRVGWRRGSGLVFSGVSPGSIAESAGIRPTDRIVSINDRPFADIDLEDLSRLADASPMTVEIERDGSRQKLRLRLDEGKRPTSPSSR